MGDTGAETARPSAHLLSISRVRHLPVDVDVLRSWFPVPVEVAFRQDDPGELLLAGPGDDRLLGPDVTQARRATFLLGRAAAGQALGALGLAASPIGRGSAGEPLWPAGVVGSITHTAGLALAVVSRVAVCGGIGVDLERVLRAPTAAEIRHVCLARESIWVDEPAARSARSERFTALFATKEAVYKALDPRWRVRLGFHDVEVRALDGPPYSPAVAVAHGRADVELPVGWWSSEGLLLAATYLPPRVPAASLAPAGPPR